LPLISSPASSIPGYGQSRAESADEFTWAES
jgi:hypothetical protein